MAQAGHILKKMAVGPWYFELNELMARLFGKVDFVFGTLAIPLLLRFESWCGSNRDVSAAISSMTLARRWLLYVGLTILILLFGIFDSKSFIYFQF